MRKAVLQKLTIQSATASTSAKRALMHCLHTSEPMHTKQRTDVQERLTVLSTTALTEMRTRFHRLVRTLLQSEAVLL